MFLVSSKGIRHEVEPNGYSSVTSDFLKEFKITGFKSIDNNGVLTLKSPNETYVTEGISSVDIFKGFLMNNCEKYDYGDVRTFSFLDNLYEKFPEVPIEHFCIDVYGDYDDEFLSYHAHLQDGRDDMCHWVMIIPNKISASDLSKVIERQFIGIGGILSDNNSRFFKNPFKSVYFMKDSYTMNDSGSDIEYGSYVTHAICPEDLVDLYYSKVEKDFLFSENYISDEELDPVEREMLVPYIMRKISPKKIKPISGYTCGIQYIVGIPLEIQIEACAIVAGITKEQMKSRMDLVSEE